MKLDENQKMQAISWFLEGYDLAVIAKFYNLNIFILRREIDTRTLAHIPEQGLSKDLTERLRQWGARKRLAMAELERLESVAVDQLTDMLHRKRIGKLKKNWPDSPLHESE